MWSPAMSPATLSYLTFGGLLVVVLATWVGLTYLLRRTLTPRVFISYRRDDTGQFAEQLGADLANRFGPGRVFLDRSTIPYGEPWSSVLAGWLDISNVVVALVGERWDGGKAPD